MVSYDVGQYMLGPIVWDTENPLALSVIAVCADMSSATAGWANQITDMFGFGCRNGCYTCAKVGLSA